MLMVIVRRISANGLGMSTQHVQVRKDLTICPKPGGKKLLPIQYKCGLEVILPPSKIC